MVKKIIHIGEELVGHAQEAETSRRGLADELFPYIWVASKKMSTRAISRWLEEKQGLQLSAATIAKTLRESNQKMQAWVQEIREKEIEFYSMIESIICHPSAPTALFDHDEFEKRALERNNYLSAQISNSRGGYAHLLELYNAINEEWFALPAEFRDECKKYIDKQTLEKSPASVEAPAEQKQKKEGKNAK